MAKGIKREIAKALDNVQHEISGDERKGFYAAGLAGEGYAGGYRQALYDMIAALNGVPPLQSRYWPSPNPSLNASQPKVIRG